MTLLIALKRSKVRFDLLTYYNQYLKFEAGLRGGLTQASHRYSRSAQPGDPNYRKEELTALVDLAK